MLFSTCTVTNLGLLTAVSIVLTRVFGIGVLFGRCCLPAAHVWRTAHHAGRCAVWTVGRGQWWEPWRI